MSKITVDVRRQKSVSAKTVAANKDRLKVFASAIEAELEEELLGLGNGVGLAPVGAKFSSHGASSLSSSSAASSGSRITPRELNWKHSLLGCGSNAFSQLSLGAHARPVDVQMHGCVCVYGLLTETSLTPPLPSPPQKANLCLARCCMCRCTAMWVGRGTPRLLLAGTACACACGCPACLFISLPLSRLALFVC